MSIVLLAVVLLLAMMGVGLILWRKEGDLTTDDAVRAGQRSKQIGKAVGGLLGIGTVSLAGAAWQTGMGVVEYGALLADIVGQSPVTFAGLVNVGLIGAGLTEWFGPIRAMGIMLMVLGVGVIWRVQQTKNRGHA
ncbi:hypothetical protein ACFQL9_13050 [Halobaculum lipolyticum]|uniref:Uncharacterized protein n=1 Tax=Halobaculum lipolyticum TaxID=3032001 RepID=A0ABD5WB96_9EURY